MRIEELQHALDDLAGNAPDVDDAFRLVMSRASRERRRSRVGIAALCALVIAGAAFGVVQLGSSDRHVSVVGSAAPNDLAHLGLTRIAAPSSDIVRVVTANAQTFAVGATPGVEVIYKLDAGGAASIAFRGTAGAPDPRATPAINDVAGVPGGARRGRASTGAPERSSRRCRVALDRRRPHVGTGRSRPRTRARVVHDDLAHRRRERRVLRVRKVVLHTDRDVPEPGLDLGRRSPLPAHADESDGLFGLR